ncbi:uncharacterized protein BDZ99DRAFT_422669 [Mytilinidion resinicola]|uniref:Heterokaryon incompatibility domain-containing protein n=1 Tax=Mytilinidion resinicola TaxID=574789 RepID=A0A6A6YCF2_9PEZI|nr:uncharacterized protein BDZ99DRAFT_422669 [Mytilinidion resinicola]KAF2806258.1 hypothetical protein BDZ99DRAFT_422669 [Mytilinidion resinicola]
MGQIYERAMSTVAWVGREDEDISAMMLDLPNMLQKAREFVGNPASKVVTSGFPVSRPPGWLGLYKLFLRPWFRRLWVVQEAVLSRAVLLVCGESVVNADSLLPLIDEQGLYTSQVLVQMNRPLMPPKDLWKGLGCFRLVCTLRKPRLEGTFVPQGLPELTSMTEDFLAFDPRDRVYSLLGITNSFWRDLVSVSYQIPTETLYIDLATLWLANRPHLLTLNQASSRPPMPDLPTWCPNFNEVPVPVRLGIVYKTAGYSAGVPERRDDWIHWQWSQLQDEEHYTSSSSLAPEPRIVSTRLPVKGFLIGYAESVVPPGWLVSYDNNPDRKMIAASLKWEKECLRISQSVYNQLNSIPIGHARTLVANKTLASPPHRRYTGDIVGGYEETIERFSNQDLEDNDLSETILEYMPSLQIACLGRAFFSTSSGSVGIGPGDLKVGDMICIFDGGVTPFIIRPKSDDPNLYEFFGEAYVDGIMYGEALETEEAKNVTTFTLV